MGRAANAMWVDYPLEPREESGEGDSRFVAFALAAPE